MTKECVCNECDNLKTYDLCKFDGDCSLNNADSTINRFKPIKSLVAITFLDFYELTDKTEYMRDCGLWSEEHYEYMVNKRTYCPNESSCDFALSEYFELMKKQPTIELIKRLFKFEKTQDSCMGLYISSGNDWHINLIVGTDIFCCGEWHMPYPLTIDMFISNCKQCEIELEWKL